MLQVLVAVLVTNGYCDMIVSLCGLSFIWVYQIEQASQDDVARKRRAFGKQPDLSARRATRMIVQYHAVIATVMHGGWSRQASVIINEEKGEMVWWYPVVESCSYQNNLRIL